MKCLCVCYVPMCMLCACFPVCACVPVMFRFACMCMFSVPEYAYVPTYTRMSVEARSQS